MTPQNSKSNKNKINNSGLKSAITHNNSVKPNSDLIHTLKIAVPQFFDKDGGNRKFIMVQIDEPTKSDILIKLDSIGWTN
ncbi:MAG: hypothetical protein LBF88_08780 [Planctomycetaceae bacterium]|jgi:hypothetical protein|nr:hypothetical protein [Planctomycetaceae bacterium]